MIKVIRRMIPKLPSEEKVVEFYCELKNCRISDTGFSNALEPWILFLERQFHC
jgi:hypothetical protein